MNNSPQHQTKYIRAKERVEELKKFYTSLTSYLIFIPFLAWINYATNGLSYAWFLWAAFGWGIGLLFQAVKAFRLSPIFNRDWEERKIREFMREEEFNQSGKQEDESWDDKINWDTDKNYNTGQRWE